MEKCDECDQRLHLNGKCKEHYELFKKRSYDRKYNRKRKPPNDEVRYHRLIHLAKRRGLKVSITVNQYLEVIAKKTCYYCGGKLTIYGGNLDRLDSLKGYDIDNIVPCCGYCNILRSSLLSVEETIEIVKLLKRMRQTENIWNNIQKGFIFNGKKDYSL
jgi:hypothetical protein